MSNHFHTGHNMPGYLPEADIYVTGDWEAARDSLADEVNRSADWVIESDDGDPDRAARLAEIEAEYTEAIEEISNLKPGAEYGDILPASDSEHDLGVSFWLIECHEDLRSCLVNSGADEYQIREEIESASQVTEVKS